MSLAKDFMTLLSGRLSSQLILVLSTPILTRLYAPEDFGLVSLVSSITQVPVIYLMGRLDQAIPQSHDDEEAGRLVALAFSFACLITLLCLLFSYLGQSWLVEHYNSQDLPLILMTAIVLFIPLSLSKIGKQWAAYRERHGVTASADVLGMLCQRGLPLAFFAIIGGGPWSLYLGQAFAFLVSASVFLSRIGQDCIQQLCFVPKQLWQTLKEYKDFPLYLGASSLIDVSMWSLVSILLGDFFGLAAIAWYGQAYALLFLPISLLNQSSSNIFYPKLAQAREKQEDLNHLAKIMTNLSFDLSLYPLFILLPLAPQLWGILLGESFQMSGEIAQFLVPMAVVNMTFSPLSLVVNVFHKQKAFFKQSIAQHSLRILAFYIGCLSGNILWAFAGFVLVTVPFKLWQINWLLKVMNVSIRGLIAGGLIKVIYTMSWVILLYFLRDVSHLPFIYLLLTAVLGGLGWIIMIIHYNAEAKQFLRDKGWLA